MAKSLPLYRKGALTEDVCWVDDDIAERMRNIRLSLDEKGYVRLSINNVASVLHRIVMCAIPHDGNIVDHINHNRTDNRRQNLRFVTASFNSHNVVRCNKSSQFIGVSTRRTVTPLWRCSLSRISYPIEEEAAISYNYHAIKKWGPDANINRNIIIPPEWSPKHIGSRQNRNYCMFQERKVSSYI